jgi:hypothetical protein
MLVRLFCPKCAYEVAQRKQPHAFIEVPVPISEVREDGQYEVRCEAGHVSLVTLDNVQFELLFELGINALYDGYGREAVSSFSASLERFYEFYWRVVMESHSVSIEAVANAWKPLSKQSERQLGAYVSAALSLGSELPKLLDPNKEVRFRNDVIHGGRVPTREEALRFGDVVMDLIMCGLNDLREHAPEALAATYAEMVPRSSEVQDASDDDHTGTVNILTAVDVRYPPKQGDRSVGGLEEQLSRIEYERRPFRMELVSEEGMKRRCSDRIPDAG